MTAFGGPGDVSKSLLLVKPEFSSNAELISSVRFDLINRGFVIVREESRNLTKEQVDKVAAGSTANADVLASLVGSAYVLVVARVNAIAELQAFVEEGANVDKLFCAVGTAAPRAVLALFPSMVVDPIPSDAEANDFVHTELKSLLVAGLTEVAKKKPENPVEWFARYLLENNPNKPSVTKA